MKKRWTVIGCVGITWLIGLLLASRFQTVFTKSTFVPEILLFEETPSEVAAQVQVVFPEYNVRKIEHQHLAKFFEGTEIILAYDIQAYPLIQNNDETYFYPLYQDCVVFAVDREEPIRDWQDIAGGASSVSLLEREPEQRYIWMNLAYGLTGKLDKMTAVDELARLYQAGRLNWGERNVPVQISLHSYLVTKPLIGKEMVYPTDSFCFQVGLLSHRPLLPEKIERIQAEYRRMGFLSVIGENMDGTQIYPARSMPEEVSGFGSIQTLLVRNIHQKRKYAPTNGVEHHAVTLGLIIATCLGISYVYKTVIHLGVRKGISFIGFVLIGFMMLMVFKYSYSGSSGVTRGLWYSFYLFILALPPANLYILANINCWDKRVFPRWLKIAWTISAGLFLLVITNDYHQWVFFFLTENKDDWSDQYRHAWGYYLVAIWMLLTQVGTWIFLVWKSWDSPRKRMSVLPLLVLLLGLMYSVFYNLKIPFFHEISLALGMSGLGILFWGSILMSGLVPSNSGYWELFENSRLAMKIFDEKGNLCFESKDVKEAAMDDRTERERML